ncbi:MAG TPA: hypothetical protein LFW21_07370 [Rickettsia endosymbiont of Pyrocoelia pectoralis]|nr:hypothetical protein [Rickettsia endosymbiont of Pyrocoelia pectoralis]
MYKSKFQYDKTGFYTTHFFEYKVLAKDFYKGEVEFDLKLIKELYNGHYTNIYKGIFNNLLRNTSLHEPKICDKYLIIKKYGFLLITYKGKNLIAYNSDFKCEWNNVYSMKLEEYALEATTESYDDKVFYLNSYR